MLRKIRIILKHSENEGGMYVYVEVFILVLIKNLFAAGKEPLKWIFKNGILILQILFCDI